MEDCIMANIIAANNISADLASAAIRGINDRINAAADSLYTASKEKYVRKAKLIESARGMTVKEKLDALDQNYDRHNQEVWQGIIIVGVISFALAGLASGNRSIIKTIRRLVA